MNRKLVIISNVQFGYNIASYYYCKYLADKFSITYICWDYNLEKVTMPGVQVKYVRRTRGIGKIVPFIRCILDSSTSRKTVLFIKYFRLISTFIRLCRPGNPCVLDIRSGSVSRNILIRFFWNSGIKLESMLYQHITVISKSLAKRLRLEKKATILPLGADILSNDNKKFNNFHLLYIGTLHNRNIDKTLMGFIRFFNEHHTSCSVKYTIIGAGQKKGNEVQLLKDIVRQANMENVIKILGRIPHEQAKKYFESHNIGLSYVPITRYFDVQPPTKTFEYLLAGMPVIATRTTENKLVINESNGILIGDNPDDIYNGLINMHTRRLQYNSEVIRKDSIRYCWKSIVNNLQKYLSSI